MFFPKVRRQAKWVFVLLALVFGLGFVVFGVGSGGGIGLGDLFNNGGSTQGSASASKARDRIKKNPKDAAAYKDLATALQTDGDLKGSVAAWKKYTTLRPRDTDALNTLAGLYTALGQRLQPQITTAQIASQDSSFAAQLIVGLQAKKQPVVGTNVIDQSLSTVANTKLNTLYQQQQDDFNEGVRVNQRIVKLDPKDANAQLSLGEAAQSAGNSQVAITAYTRFIKLAPQDPTTSLVKQQIKALKQAAKQQPTVQPG
jgi:cytochrome c-type biogenesis protein CcmH/NrfG